MDFTLNDISNERLCFVSEYFKTMFSGRWTAGSQIEENHSPWGRDKCPEAFFLLMRFIHTGQVPKDHELTPDFAQRLLGATGYYMLQNDNVVETVEGYVRDESRYCTRDGNRELLSKFNFDDALFSHIVKRALEVDDEGYAVLNEELLSNALSMYPEKSRHASCLKELLELF